MTACKRIKIKYSAFFQYVTMNPKLNNRGVSVKPHKIYSEDEMCHVRVL